MKKSVLFFLLFTYFLTGANAQERVHFNSIAVEYSNFIENTDSLKTKYNIIQSEIITKRLLNAEIYDSLRATYNILGHLFYDSIEDSLAWEYYKEESDIYDSGKSYIYLTAPVNRLNHKKDSLFQYTIKITKRKTNETMIVYLFGDRNIIFISNDDILKINGLHFQKGIYLLYLVSNKVNDNYNIPENYKTLVTYKSDLVGDHFYKICTITNISQFFISDKKRRHIMKGNKIEMTK